MEAALVHRVEALEAALTGFKHELETDGPRTGALGGNGGGESKKINHIKKQSQQND